jgi:hypothetical protein
MRWWRRIVREDGDAWYSRVREVVVILRREERKTDERDQMAGLLNLHAKKSLPGHAETTGRVGQSVTDCIPPSVTSIQDSRCSLKTPTVWTVSEVGRIALQRPAC